MKNKIQAVQRFHEAFKIGYRTAPKADLGAAKNQLRFDLMKEKMKSILKRHRIMISWRLPMLLAICFIFFVVLL